jgi:hypothetical protein
MAAALRYRLGGDALDPTGHLRRGAPRERQQQDPVRVGTVDDQVPDPMGESIGLARSRAGDDQQGGGAVPEVRPAMFDGPPLLRVE